jgi:DNA-binding MarR family transcriptional regulator
MAVKNKRSVPRRTPAQQRETWLRALSAADDPRHVVPTLVIYRLLKLSNLISRPFLAEDSVRYRISLNELRILMTLAPMREAASHELANVAGMHPMNVSRAVAALRRHGRVCQRADPDNRRRKLLKLTVEGWALYRRLLPHVNKVAKAVFRDLTRTEITQLSRLIDMMTSRLEKLPIDVAGAGAGAGD